MRGPHNIIRLIRTGATLVRTGAMNVVLDAFDAPALLRMVAYTLGWPFQWLGYKGDPSMPPATRAITALGPAYIKFGQVLSTRPDVVGEDMARQLRVLQDKLPPFPRAAEPETPLPLGLLLPLAPFSCLRDLRRGNSPTWTRRGPRWPRLPRALSKGGHVSARYNMHV